MQKALLAEASRTSLFGHFGAAGPAAVSVTLQNGESSRVAWKKSMITKAGEQVAQAGNDPKVEVSSSDEENESKMHPDTRKAYRDDMEESYGIGYATRASEMGYGERYGEAVKAVLDKKADKSEMQRGATSDRDQQADAWSGAAMALLRAPCGVLTAPSSNVARCRSGSLKSQFLATSGIQRSGRRNGMFVRRVGGRDSISADSSGIIRKDQVSAGDDNNNVLASASIESAPVKCSEQEEFAKEWAHKPRRVVLFVEPSPFSYISGYKNRYQNFIKYLRELGDEVLVVTTHHGAPAEFLGAKVVPSWSFGLPLYKAVPLSLALSPRIYKEVKNFKPDIIHASSPGIMVIGALIISKLVGVPMVMAYHTHVPMYIPKYTFAWLVKPMWLLIKILHRAADLTLVMSVALSKELRAAGASTAEQIRIWRRGVDSDSFHPRFRNAEMRNKITGGKPDTPTIVHVGRLGVEKNLDFLVQVLGRIPEARLVFVGDGPERTNLENMFAGKNVHFTGMLTGEALSQAYASGDIFITPSESETLGFVVLEAMASGIPVVCARAGGIPDVVNQDGVTGLLYTPGDLEDCVGKLKALIDSPELRDRIGCAGRREVEKFDWRASTKQVRNEEYSAAIWFWRRRKQQLANRFSGWFKRPLPQAL